MRPLGTVFAGTGRTRIFARVYEMGSDLLVILGGEGLHIGAASLAERVPGGGIAPRRVEGRGHKEGELTDKMASRLVEATGRRTLAVGGIHLDRITRDEIESIRENVDELSRSIVTVAESGGGDRPKI